MDKYECTICGYIYDEAEGDADNGIAAGTNLLIFRKIGYVRPVVPVKVNSLKWTNFNNQWCKKSFSVIYFKEEDFLRAAKNEGLLLSRAFKEEIVPSKEDDGTDGDAGQSREKFLYYNAFTEDLFYWDNDSDKKLIIRDNSFTPWVLEEQGQTTNITTNFQHYTSDKLTPLINENKNEISFSIEGGNEDKIENISNPKSLELIPKNNQKKKKAHADAFYIYDLFECIDKNFSKIRKDIKNEYIENKLREAFGFTGTPIKILARKRS